MTRLSLGVTDLPYSWGAKTRGGISAAKAMRTARQVAAGKMPAPSSSAGVTTYDVARWLEERYGVMETFFDLRGPQIVAAIENSIGGALETALMGGPRSRSRIYAQATSDIEDMFRNAISMRAFDGKIAGVPTAAAMAGISHRFKNPYKSRAPRPSFLDTGLYSASFRAWEGDAPP